VPKKPTTPKRPRDVNQLAHLIVAISTGEQSDDVPTPVNENAARRGAARAAKLSPKRRKEIARKAARTRWNKQG
jgi:hypothetical protein